MPIRPLRLLPHAVGLALLVVGVDLSPAEELLPTPPLKAPPLVAPDEPNAGRRRDSDPPVDPTQAVPRPTTPLVESTDQPAADESAAPDVAASHRWARFEPGAWRRVRSVSQSFTDGEESITSVTERTERLIEVDRDSYTIEVTNTLPLGTQTAAAPAVRQRLWVLTDRPTDLGRPRVARGEPTSISLGGVVVPCSVWTVTTAGAAATETQTIATAGTGEPMVLRRESTSDQGGAPGPAVLESVTRTDQPIRFGDSLLSSWRTTTTVAHADGGRAAREAISAIEAPGGLVLETTSEYDATGRRLRWEVTELVAAGLTPEDEVPAAGAPSAEPAISIEVRPRRFLRMLRRESPPPPGT